MGYHLGYGHLLDIVQMTPVGARGFKTSTEAKEAAVKAGTTSFVVLQNAPRPFMLPEFAWVAPVEFFISRAAQAMAAGIAVVEMVTG